MPWYIGEDCYENTSATRHSRALSFHTTSPVSDNWRSASSKSSPFTVTVSLSIFRCNSIKLALFPRKWLDNMFFNSATKAYIKFLPVAVCPVVIMSISIVPVVGSVAALCVATFINRVASCTSSLFTWLRKCNRACASDRPTKDRKKKKQWVHININKIKPPSMHGSQTVTYV